MHGTSLLSTPGQFGPVSYLRRTSGLCPFFGLHWFNLNWFNEFLMELVLISNISRFSFPFQSCIGTRRFHEFFHEKNAYFRSFFSLRIRQIETQSFQFCFKSSILCYQKSWQKFVKTIEAKHKICKSKTWSSTHLWWSSRFLAFTKSRQPCLKWEQ